MEEPKIYHSEHWNSPLFCCRRFATDSSETGSIKLPYGPSDSAIPWMMEPFSCWDWTGDTYPSLTLDVHEVIFGNSYHMYKSTCILPFWGICFFYLTDIRWFVGWLTFFFRMNITVQPDWLEPWALHDLNPLLVRPSRCKVQQQWG